jgi:hypothetical protein
MFPDQIGPPWYVGVKLHIFNAVARFFNTLATIFQHSCSFNGKLLPLQQETRPYGFPYIMVCLSHEILYKSKYAAIDALGIWSWHF